MKLPARARSQEALTARHAKRAAIAFAAFGALVTPAHAARPLITDDARIVDAGACQVESWLKHGEGLREAWALPGCNFTGNLEVTAGGGRIKADGSASTTWQLQGWTSLGLRVLTPKFMN